MSTPRIPGVDRFGLADAIEQNARPGAWGSLSAADAALAYIAAHHECALPACTCGAKYDRCPDCTSDDAYEQGRKDAACDREHADEWVEVDGLDAFPTGARVRQEWVRGDVTTPHRYFAHRDDLPDDLPSDLPDDPRALIARELGAARVDTFLWLLDEHGWTVTRKGER